MAEFTTNYNLEKPAQNEFYNVEVQNQNMDKIDAALAGAKFIVAPTGEKYKWGMDAIGLFLEEV